jgi:hypothetical protein
VYTKNHHKWNWLYFSSVDRELKSYFSYVWWMAQVNFYVVFHHHHIYPSVEWKETWLYHETTSPLFLSIEKYKTWNSIVVVFFAEISIIFHSKTRRHKWKIIIKAMKSTTFPFFRVFFFLISFVLRSALELLLLIFYWLTRLGSLDSMMREKTWTKRSKIIVDN